MAYRSDYGSRIGDLLNRSAERQGQLGVARGDAWAAMSQAPMLGIQAYQGQVDRENQLRQQEAYQGYMGSLRQQVETGIADDRAAKQVAARRQRWMRKFHDPANPSGFGFQEAINAAAKYGDHEFAAELKTRHNADLEHAENLRLQSRARDQELIDDAARSRSEATSLFTGWLRQDTDNLLPKLRAEGNYAEIMAGLNEQGVATDHFRDDLAAYGTDEAAFRRDVHSGIQALREDVEQLEHLDTGHRVSAYDLGDPFHGDYTENVKTALDSIKDTLKDFARSGRLTSQADLDAVVESLATQYGIDDTNKPGQRLLWDMAEARGWFTFVNQNDYRDLLNVEYEIDDPADVDASGDTPSGTGTTGSRGPRGNFPLTIAQSVARQLLGPDANEDDLAEFYPDSFVDAIVVGSRQVTGLMSRRELGEIEQAMNSATDSIRETPWIDRTEWRETADPARRGTLEEFKLSVGEYWGDEGLSAMFDEIVSLADENAIKPEGLPENEWEMLLGYSRDWGARLEAGEDPTVLIQEMVNVPNPRVDQLDPNELASRRYPSDQGSIEGPNARWFQPRARQGESRDSNTGQWDPDSGATLITPTDSAYFTEGTALNYLINRWNQDRIDVQVDRVREAYNGVNTAETTHLMDSIPTVYFEAMVDGHANRMADLLEEQEGRAVTDAEFQSFVAATEEAVLNLSAEEMPSFGEIKKWLNSMEAKEFLTGDPEMVAFLPYLQDANWAYMLQTVSEHPGWSPSIPGLRDDAITSGDMDPRAFGKAWMTQFRDKETRSQYLSRPYMDTRSRGYGQVRGR